MCSALAACIFREPSGAAQHKFLTESTPKLDDSAWDAYWGWDCAGPHGLCDRVYNHLRIPQSQWSGLKHLPTASKQESDSQSKLIKQNRAKLDKALDKLPEPEVVSASEVVAAAEQVAETEPTADQFSSQAGNEDEKDEDMVRDLNRVRSQKQPTSGQQAQPAHSKPVHPICHSTLHGRRGQPGPTDQSCSQGTSIQCSY